MVTAQDTVASFTSFLTDLHQVLRDLFIQRSRAQGRQQNLLQRRLLLGLELLWKIEEQVVMPALQLAAPASAPDVVLATQEIELMRDLALRIESSGSTARTVALAALEGMVRLHCVASDALLVGADSNGVDWRALHKEVLDLLARWRTEMRVDGEIEDEERDPVGLPPR